MRRAAFIAVPIALLAAASVAYAAVSGAPRVSLSQAVSQTARVSSQRYLIDVHVTKDGQPLTLHVHGVTAPQVASVQLKMANMKLPGGQVVQGESGAELLDGPFLYERAPGTASYGTVRWLRVPVSSLSSSAPPLQALHAFMPAALLHVLAESHAVARSRAVYAGPVSYSDPVVRTGLAGVTGGIEFRNLHVSATVGRDGLVHRIVVTGITADRSETLRVVASLYDFGARVTVTPPALGTFVDRQAEALAV